MKCVRFGECAVPGSASRDALCKWNGTTLRIGIVQPEPDKVTGGVEQVFENLGWRSAASARPSERSPRRCASSIINRRSIQRDDQLIQIRFGVLIKRDHTVNALGAPPTLRDRVAADLTRAHLENQVFQEVTVGHTGTWLRLHLVHCEEQAAHLKMRLESATKSSLTRLSGGRKQLCWLGVFMDSLGQTVSVNIIET